MATPSKQVKLNEIADLDTFYNGGKGSGNFGHSGRPGEVGGSGKGGTNSRKSDARKRLEKALDSSFKKRYAKDYPDDYQLDKIKDVTFREIAKGLAAKKDIYDIIGDVDSVIRERAFGYLTDMTKMDYDDFYDAWSGRKSPRFQTFEDEYLK